MSLISLYLCSSAMWLLITVLELLRADARSSSSDSGSPEGVVVGIGRPEGSLACVARWERWALRSDRVCSRVDFLASRAVRRGLLVGLWIEVVFELLVGSVFPEDGGAVVVAGSVGLGDSWG